MNRFLFVMLATVIGLSACSKKEEVATQMPPGHAAPSAAGPNTGKILQTQNAGGYTYAEVQTGDGQKVWIAGGQIQVKNGDMVQWGQYAVMQNFTAKSLGRTFDQILFVNAWSPVGGPVAQVAPHGVYPTGQPAAAMPGAAPAPVAATSNQGQVKTATNAGGYTYLEVAQGSGSTWLAVTETPVKVGDTVRWDGGAVMQNFTAKSLNRTFDQIVFAGGVTVVR